ncbi:MAG: hypothetical protein U1E29_02700 [Coriobacteriia bacterium]|nr:hypothetical protein [Coriobacteriia bacterium]
MLKSTEYDDRFEVVVPMRIGTRLLLAAASLIPLLAPYELLLRVEWESLLNPFFIFAALISLGAVALSGLLLLAAIAGLSARIVFDLTRATVTYSTWAPVIRRRTSVFPLAAIERVEAGTREWSDASPTHHVRVSISGGTVIEIGSDWNLGDIDRIFCTLTACLIDRRQIARPPDR